MEPIIVEHLMTKPVHMISMDDSVYTIREIFESHQYHHLVVMGDNGECAGVISDRDLLKSISPFIGKFAERTADLSCLKRRAHQIMTRELVAVRQRTSLRAALRVMLDHRISCLPVVDSDRCCVGIITLRDIARWAVTQMDDEQDHQSAA